MVKLYVSYAWSAEGSDDAGVVSRLEAVTQGSDVELVRDIRRIGYGQSIRSFMDEIGAADQVVLVLSEAYFRSPYCMYELRAVHGHADFRRRVHPVVLKGCALHDPLWWVDILEHWEVQAHILEGKLGKISRAHTKRLHETLDDYVDFR
ncbi:MAG TPA: toll/interleukin-1 receptor domain-containing protein, partial [Rhodocyclaceae bacterium]|nr:toll/interleukin-1 receptor domain-containing protein [Rhodocyclaceae bacterium]